MNVGFGFSTALEANPRILADLRLRALAESGEAFSLASPPEWTWTSTDWENFTRLSRWFVIYSGRLPVAMAGLAQDPDRPKTERYLHSMWIDPGYRGRSLSRQLVQAAAAEAQRQHATRLTLWVFRDNTHARRVYARLGFRVMGKIHPLTAATERRVEQRLYMEVADAIALGDSS